jgi:hypothetical protein
MDDYDYATSEYATDEPKKKKRRTKSKKKDPKATYSDKDHKTGQTAKPVEDKPEGEQDNTVRAIQTPGWTNLAPEEYEPTSHTTGRIKKQVLEVLPSVGSEADHSDVVMGAAVKVKSSETFQPVKKGTWDYDQPERSMPNAPAEHSATE